MKTSELMLGDWCMNPLGAIGKIDAMRHIFSRDKKKEIEEDVYQFKLAYDEHGESYCWLSIDEVQPIPITAEILEQNGFGYVEHDESGNLSHYYLGEKHFCKDMGLHIGTDNKGNYWLNYPWYEIYGLCYVHELQHALRMCHIIMEIKL